MLNIPSQRLHNQQIENPNLKNPAEVLTWLGAIQGQDYAGAKWSLGLRLPGSSDADIEQAFAEKSIVRTWVMRGTLHFLAAADLRWLLDLLAPRMIAGSGPRHRQLELDEPTFSRSNDLLLKALEGGQALDRKALFAVLEANGISTQGQRGIHILQRASLEGLLVQGAARSNVAIFTRIDEALPGLKSIPRETALAELARRYFQSRGPATLADLAWWSGLRMADARAGLEAVKSQLVSDTIDGETYWRADTGLINPASSPNVHLPTGFDEYLLGYKVRDAVLDPQHVTRVVPGKNGVFFPTIVLDGRIVGTWKRSFKKGQVMIEPSPFERLSDTEMAAFASAAQRYGAYLQMPVQILA